MRLASAVASLLKRLYMLETEMLEEEATRELLCRAILADECRHEKRNRSRKSPIGVSSVLECTRQTSFW